MDFDPPIRHAFVIGDWRVEPSAGRLVRDDGERRLRPQLMELLVALASRPGEVFSKAELLDAVWGDRFVSESALTTAIGELRDALDDRAKEPRFIQTVPKRGYRLVADVRDGAATSDLAQPDVHPHPDLDPDPPTDAVLTANEPPAIAPPVAASRQARVWPLALSLVILVGLFATAATWRDASTRRGSPPIEVPISLMADDEPASTIQTMTLSPDGRMLVYAINTVAGRPLMRRDLETRAVLPMPGTEGAASPFFSPDGAWIGFWQNGMLRRMPVRGGGSDRIESIGSARAALGGAWRSNGDLVYAPATFSGLLLRPAGEQTTRVLTDPALTNDETSLRWPEALPDSPFVLFVADRRTSPQIQAINVTTGERHVVVENGTLARFAAPDRLIYSQDSLLMTAPFDPRTARVTGAAVELERGVSNYSISHIPQFSVCATGVLAYITDRTQINRELVLVDRAGVVTPLGTPPRPYIQPRVSPDGTRLAMWLETHESSYSAEIWTYDLRTKQLTRQPTGDAASYRPLWSPDGQQLAYDAGRPSNVYTLRLSPTAPPQPLMRRDRSQMAEDWLPDGQTLVISQAEPDTGRDLHLVNVDTRETRALAHEDGDESGAAVSPSGRWVAYVWSDRTNAGIYAVSTQADHPSRVRLASRGREPRWSRDGGELFFRDRGVMYSVRLTEANGTLTAAEPRELFRGEFEERPQPRANYDVMPDGRFVMLRRTDPHPEQSIILSLNWRDRLDLH